PVLAHGERDPKVFWHEPTKQWIMVLYGPPGNQYLIFTSKNLLNWEKQGAIPDMYECPDMFPLQLDNDPKQMKWVVIAGDGQYLVGEFDGKQFRPEIKRKRGDFSPNFYATQSWNNMPETDPRRIQVAWLRGGSYPKMPFNQQWTFPCELTLHSGPNGPTVYRYPIAEIEKLWDKTETIGPTVLQPGGENPLAKLTGKYFDLHVKIDVAKTDAKEIVFDLLGKKIRYHVGEKLLDACDAGAKNCPSKAPLEPVDGHIELRFLVDCSSIETFGNHGAVSISQFIQPNLTKTPLVIEAVGGKAQLDAITVHTMKSMWE
ncbi:MAG: GH32 C-terminal domain-containing protein, partial [Planctomycetia bacterium]|nr:GH32 C-terminal domain-containing protein [Planctomycetia bacterium]